MTRAKFRAMGIADSGRKNMNYEKNGAFATCGNGDPDDQKYRAKPEGGRS
jgi:hypothetical protein